jgi:hypothetical protein
MNNAYVEDSSYIPGIAPGRRTNVLPPGISARFTQLLDHLRGLHGTINVFDTDMPPTLGRTPRVGRWEVTARTDTMCANYLHLTIGWARYFRCPLLGSYDAIRCG